MNFDSYMNNPPSFDPSNISKELSDNIKKSSAILESVLKDMDGPDGASFNKQNAINSSDNQNVKIEEVEGFTPLIESEEVEKDDIPKEFLKDSGSTSVDINTSFESKDENNPKLNAISRLREARELFEDASAWTKNKDIISNASNIARVLGNVIKKLRREIN